MQIEEIIGTRIALAREQAAITQGELGTRLAEWLGQPWSRQAIWAAEKGKRAFTAVELIAFAHVLNIAPDFLLTPPIDVREIHMPSGVVVDRADFNTDMLPTKESSEIFQEMEQTLSALLHRADQFRDDIGELAIQLTEARALSRGDGQ